MRMIGDLVHKGGTQSGCEPSLWKLDLLLIPKFRELAAHEAAAADMLVIAAHDRESLTVTLQTWIETWPVRTAGRRGALVALLELGEGRTEVRAETLMFLRNAAETSQMDLFVQSFQPPARNDLLTAELIAQRAVAVSSVLDDILHHPAPAPRWGINE